MKRRKFVKRVALAGVVGLSARSVESCNEVKHPFYVATWNNEDAVKTAIEKYSTSSSLLEGLVKGINYVEDNPADQSVGYGGRPDREGNVTLDACIMDEKGNAGSVCYVQNYKNPISIAHDVMVETPHVILAGAGAESFAKQMGYKKENLLTEESKEQYAQWLKKSEYKPIINIENHDTIGMLAYEESKIVGGCSTSGLSYKMAGRVGDSPIIGSGLFVDNEVGACVATGLGEKVLTNLSSFLVVELMRGGASPEAACKEALKRIIAKEDGTPNFQVGLIAVSKEGKSGAYALYEGFNYVYASATEFWRKPSPYFYTYK